MKVIDAHQHFWTKEVSSLRERPPEIQKILAKDYLPEHLRPILDKVGVDATVLVQTHSTMDNTHNFLKIADMHDWVSCVVGWVDLTDPGVGDVLDSLQKHPKFKGVRHQWEDESDAGWIMRKDVIRGLREVAKRGLCYDLLVKPRNWEFVPRILEAVPELPIVINHIAKPQICNKQFDDWSAMMGKAAKFPQVMCKLSGMQREADWKNWTTADLRPYVERVIELFGVDRVMYGSDWPVCLLAATYEQVWDSMNKLLGYLNTEERAKVFGENAKKFYSL